MEDDLRRNYGEDFFEHGIVHPITHTLDLAYAHYCTAKVARAVGDVRLAEELEARAGGGSTPSSPRAGCCATRSSTRAASGTTRSGSCTTWPPGSPSPVATSAFVRMLDAFFGYGAYPVKQPGRRPEPEEMAAGYALNRFEGLNNEPDMEAPWAYHYAGRPDRTAEVVHAALTWQWGTGPGGLPGNDDSGGLSSWYVWASLGLFPIAGQNLFLVNAPAFARAALGSVTASSSSRRAATASSRSARTASRTPAGPVRAAARRSTGGPWTRAHLSAVDVHRGGVLQLELGPEPSSWGTHLRPPSRRRRGTPRDRDPRAGSSSSSAPTR